jgi:hypothetical protein
MNIAKKTFLIAGANRGIGRAANETLDFLAPVQDLSVSSDSETPRNIDSAELIQRVNSLEAEKHRLQALVCSLLHENEQLRSRNLDRSSHIPELFVHVPAHNKKNLETPMSFSHRAGFTQ